MTASTGYWHELEALASEIRFDPPDQHAELPLPDCACWLTARIGKVVGLIAIPNHAEFETDDVLHDIVAKEVLDEIHRTAHGPRTGIGPPQGPPEES